MALALSVELLSFQPQTHRADTILAALDVAGRQIGLRVSRQTRYRGGSDLLVLWGPGAPDRVDPMRAQLAAGGHVIALDLAYWQRDQKFRVSIDAPHPQAWVMRVARPSGRLTADRPPIADVWNPNGPVIVAGIGEKATVQYGADTVRSWERAMIADAQAAGRTVLYRPKRPGAAIHPIPSAPAGDIDRVLQGSSRVVTWHSNVAVDAVRLGIPVICRDGAAAAIYPSGAWSDDLAPVDDATRRQFLANLSFFQWHPKEAGKCWTWLREVLG